MCPAWILKWVVFEMHLGKEGEKGQPFKNLDTYG